MTPQQLNNAPAEFRRGYLDCLHGRDRLTTAPKTFVRHDYSDGYDTRADEQFFEKMHEWDAKTLKFVCRALLVALLAAFLIFMGYSLIDLANDIRQEFTAKGFGSTGGLLTLPISVGGFLVLGWAAISVLGSIFEG